MRRFKTVGGIWLLLAVAIFSTTVPAQPSDALLVVAHGARTPGWNDRVIRAVDQIDWPGPKGVAFLMVSPPEYALDKVVTRLDEAGVSRIIVVPLLVSSFSGHYEEIRYYVGQRKDPPEHVHYDPLKTKAKLVLTPAMDNHPLVSQILIEQVRPLVNAGSRESLILVAHGPNEDDENARWLKCLRPHADRLQRAYRFRGVEVVTLRDDAPKPVRDAATEHLRAVVRAAAADSRVVVVPVLISVGHIQRQIQERLQGLEYVMSESGLADHPLMGEWIRQQAQQFRTSMQKEKPSR